MTDLTIRPAEPDDAVAVFDLLTQFVTSYPPDRGAFDRHYPRLIASDQTVFLVAAIGGQVAGYALGCLALTLFANRPVLELQELMVAPERRGRGVGRRRSASLALRSIYCCRPDMQKKLTGGIFTPSASSLTLECG